VTHIALFTFQSIYLLLMIKILSYKLYVRLSDCFWVLFSGISTGLLFPYIGIFASPILVFFICCYSYKVHHYNLNKSIFLSTLTMLIGILFDHVTSIILSIIVGETGFDNESLLLVHLFIWSILTILFTFFFTKLTKKIRVKINQNKHLQLILASITTLILASFYGSIILSTYLGNDITLIQLNLIFFIIYTVIGLIIFYFYSRTLREKYEIQRQQGEQEALQQYTTEIERQYSEMRKFKHDYQNILSSLDEFINEEDYEGLKQYYQDKIKASSRLMLKNNFRLEQLSKIEVKEVKSIIAVKLMVAHEQGIDATFEATDAITAVPMDSFVLVRALGILLDNAIEELLEIGEGKLLVGIFKSEKVTTFIVQNTCRFELPQIHQLKQAGFSTKGEGRGLGLNNLSDFAKEYKNMSLETRVIEDQFIQKIMVGG